MKRVIDFICGICAMVSVLFLFFFFMYVTHGTGILFLLFGWAVFHGVKVLCDWAKP